MRKKLPTQADVAKAAGVSQSTVSFILNPQGKESAMISEETRRKVQLAIRELGYVVNPAARSLAGGSNRIVGVFINGAAFPLEKDGFYHAYLVGIEEECMRQDYDMLLFTRSDIGNGRRSIYRDGVNHLRRADGSILLGMENKEELVRLLKEGYPFVFVGKRVVPGATIPYVAADYAAGAIRMVDRLVELGHRKFAFLYRIYNDATKDREKGIREGLAAYGLALEEQAVRLAADPAVSETCYDELTADGVTAIFTEDPLIAYQFSQAALAEGRSAPEHFSIVALSDSLLSSIPATYSQNLVMLIIPKLEMGRAAIQMLCAQLQNQAAQAAIAPCVLPVTFTTGHEQSTVGAAPLLSASHHKGDAAHD